MVMRVGVLGVAILGASCAAKPATSTTTSSSGSRTSFCSRANPDSMTKGAPMQLSVSYQLNDDFSDELQRMVKGAFTNRLNAHASGGTSFVQVDDGPSTLSIELTTKLDDSQENTGLVVAVRGPENVQTGGPTVILFTFSQEAVFPKADDMVDDAAAKVDAYVFHGWTCDAQDAATPN